VESTRVNVRSHLQPGDDVSGSVAVGLGDPNPEGSANAVILNHKGYGAKRLASVSQFVATAPQELRHLWKERIATLADVTSIVVEDCSLDTCFAWLLFGARLEERPVSSAAGFNEAAWVDYVTAWEKGEFVDVAVETSPACLSTELANALLPGPEADAASGFAACLQLLQEMLDACPSPPPGGLPSTFSSDLHRQALAQIAFDRQQYQSALRRGRTFQLLLPSSISASEAERLMIVDAAATAESEPTAVLKTMLRTDREKSWTGRGFSVWALYRPAAGPGYDMTVSTDPDRYLTLKALWARLEQLEDERWGGSRPRWNPRRGVAGYTDAQGEPTAGTPNEPWWDDNGTYSLVAAPKAVEPEKDAAEVHGSRLDWHEDVLPALWELYFLRHVRALVRFAESKEFAGRHVHVAVWQPLNATGASASDSYRLLPDAPSFHAWLAACSMRAHPLDVRSPMEMPDAEAFERVVLDGGYAIVTREGFTIFCESLSAVGSALPKVAKGMAEGIQKYSDFLEVRGPKLIRLVADLRREEAQQERANRAHARAWKRDMTARARAWRRKWARRRAGMSTTSNATKNVEELERELFHPRADVLQADARLATLPSNLDEQRLRISLARMWGLHEQRDEVRGLIDRLDQMMRQRIAMRTERRERVYGSLLSAAGLAILQSYVTGPILKLLNPPATSLQLLTVALLVIFFFLGLVLYSLFGIRGGSSH
jgi:hypothetical protein